MSTIILLTVETDPDDHREEIPEEVLREVLVVISRDQNRLNVIPVLVSNNVEFFGDRKFDRTIFCLKASIDWYDDDTRSRITTCIRGLGFQLAKDVILELEC